MHGTRLSELLRSGAIVPSLKSTKVEAVASELVDALIEAEALPHVHRESAIISILKRENASSTGLGSGVALPHAKVPFVRDFVAALGLASEGVDFNSSDSAPVKAVFLLFSPKDDPYGHLWLLGTIAGLIRQPRFVDSLLRSVDREQVRERIADAEDRLHGA
ncbi:MAG: PTS sugar transporter subunit IIA [Planctomycetes bacterium]|nr:PTS sugar transporter subunit IIA [Planctomycetota bacterium]MBI3847089.1 PTS sugar transporter subunit IIA [Planctomycetota bacterium]